MNFSHPCVNHTIAISNVDIEQPIVDQIQEDVENFEVPCGDGVWRIERCPLCRMFNVLHCKNSPSILMLQGYYYWCPCMGLLKVMVLVPWCTFKTTQVMVLCK